MFFRDFNKHLESRAVAELILRRMSRTKISRLSINAFTYITCLANVIDTKNSFPGVHFKNLFAQLQSLFTYFFTTLCPVARCFDGFYMHAKEESFP